MIGVIIGAVALYEVSLSLSMHLEDVRYWEQSKRYCEEIGKPLLLIGMRRGPWMYEQGDVTVDLDSKVLDVSGGVMADVRDMPFAPKQFGVCFCEHVLEHLPTPYDAELAINECARVSDKAVFVCPSPYSLYSNMFLPAHHLRLKFDKQNHKVYVTDNQYRTGFGYNRGVDIGQIIVSDEVAPEVVITKGGFVVDEQGISQ